MIIEINDGNYPNKEKIINLIEQANVLKENSDIENILDDYIKNYVMPKDYAGDASHLAYSSFYKMDYLFTWNCNHLANANKKQHIQIINAKLNLYTPEIVTPMQLFKEEE